MIVMGVPIATVIVLVVMVMGVPTAMVVMRAVTVVVVQIIVMVRRHRGTDGGGPVERVKEGDERAPLHPQHPHPDHDDERIADDFDHIDRTTHGRRGGAQQRGRDSDDDHRDQRLHHRRRER